MEWDFKVDEEENPVVTGLSIVQNKKGGKLHGEQLTYNLNWETGERYIGVKANYKDNKQDGEQLRYAINHKTNEIYITRKCRRFYIIQGWIQY